MHIYQPINTIMATISTFEKLGKLDQMAKEEVDMSSNEFDQKLKDVSVSKKEISLLLKMPNFKNAKVYKLKQKYKEVIYPEIPLYAELMDLLGYPYKPIQEGISSPQELSYDELVDLFFKEMKKLENYNPSSVLLSYLMCRFYKINVCRFYKNKCLIIVAFRLILILSWLL